jgi:acetyltransferase-like isoleucine patch superfamily enzyme
VETALDGVGQGLMTASPWHIHIFGSDICVGAHVEMRATPEAPIRLTTWENATCKGSILIGNHVLVGPGARLQSATRIELHDNVMLASNVLITDADWHDLHDRLSVPGGTAPVILHENAWIGDSSIICKGVTVGQNSVVGAGSVVTRDVPDNCVAAGNPARVISELDPNRQIVTRAALFEDPGALERETRDVYRLILRRNSIIGWLRSKLFPRKGD